MQFLQSSYFFDFENDAVQKLVAESQRVSQGPQESAIYLYTFVRDNWKYDPYTISLSEENYRASSVARRSSGNCVEKSILLIACLRALKIPARLHLGKVKNHIAAERLIEKFGSNELTPHGMVGVFLNETWLKMSPAFNKSLCQKFNIDPLDFDGVNSSFLQEYNRDEKLFMEYVDDYGHFEDVPLEFMMNNLKENYPHIFDTDEDIKEFKL